MGCQTDPLVRPMQPVPSTPRDEPRFGFVVIGRNEGERLLRCLESIDVRAHPTVYVDSASSDGSPAAAKSMGAEVVDLDMSLPFTAARARNAGWNRLLQLHPSLPFIQFMDGDCKLHAGWLEAARRAAERDATAAVVFGHRQEMFPDASIYNRMCHMEWKHRPGDAESCGGDAFIRTAALTQVGGYDPRLIAGEEPDLCLRLRGRGWRVLCLADAMSDHDAAIHRASQWLKRSMRSGFASAEGLARHGFKDRQSWHQTRSNFLWGALWPVGWIALAALAPAPAGWGRSAWALACLGACALGYAALHLRIARFRRHMGDAPAHARLYATLCLVGKFSECSGLALYLFNRLIGRRQRLIEYKAPASPIVQG